MGKIGDVDVALFAVDLIDQPGIVFFGGVAKISVGEGEIGLVVQKIPTDQTAGIDEVDFQILGVGDFFHVETGRGETAKRIQTASCCGYAPVRTRWTAKIVHRMAIQSPFEYADFLDLRR